MLAVVVTIVLGAGFLRMSVGGELQAVLNAVIHYYAALWMIHSEECSYKTFKKQFGAPSAPLPRNSKGDASEDDDLAFASDLPGGTELSRQQERRLGSALWLHILALHLGVSGMSVPSKVENHEAVIATLTSAASSGSLTSLLCTSRFRSTLYLVLVHPMLVLAGTIAGALAGTSGRCDWGDDFEERLLSPKPWLLLWQLRKQLLCIDADVVPVKQPAEVEEQEVNLERKVSSPESCSTMCCPSEAEVSDVE
eukprot:TRINITY_DN103604_c0_g1_i1.p1 TRINITY_DN103604_c0_g1~~TRINITY_DN103604_c0_g1_i1.p1  ORF type:complete len:252 (-),score=41.20 TRINITY_DN103604_c0_g1_i1:474-1229(-)